MNPVYKPDHFKLHAGQREIWRTAGRFNVVCCGRRFGKTVMGVILALYHLNRNRRVAWFAPNYKFLDEPWMEFRRLLKPIALRVDSQQHVIALKNGGRLDCWTLDDPDAGRGREYECAIIDEAAKARHLKYAWENAISPTLTKTLGEAWWFSTPLGRNYFYSLYQQSESDPQWRSFHAPTSSNPFIPPAEVEAERERKPDRVFRQEYLAEFMADGGGVFRRVQEAMSGPMLERGDPSIRYAIGVDWGRSHDFTVLSVIDPRQRRLVHAERFTGVGYELQVGRLKALHERFPGSILVEENSMGGPLLERLQRDKLPVKGFYTSNSSKAELVESLALALETGRLSLCDCDWLQHELLAFTAERLPGGQIRYSAPEGVHDDGVISLALAWNAAKTTDTPRYAPTAGLTRSSHWSDG